MSDIDFLFIGWCKQVKKGVTSDKIWTAFEVGGNYYAGWGRRDKAISFKKHNNLHSLNTVMRSKQKKYDEVEAFQLFTIFPYFKDEVSSRLTFCTMANKIR